MGVVLVHAILGIVAAFPSIVRLHAGTTAFGGGAAGGCHEDNCDSNYGESSESFHGLCFLDLFMFYLLCLHNSILS